jgi:hypothetical protein
MGPLPWSAVAVLVCGLSIFVVVRSVRLRNECKHAGSRGHAAEHTGELTPEIKKRPVVWFRFAFGFTVLYWAVMFGFYLISLGSASSLRLFFTAFITLTLPAVLISLALSLAFLSAGRKAVAASTMRGPVVTGIESRCALLIAGWCGVALFMVYFAFTAASRGL